MSVIVRMAGNIGPFVSIVVGSDRLVCDGIDFPFNVIGEYEISEDDGLAPDLPAVQSSYNPEVNHKATLQARLKNLETKMRKQAEVGDLGALVTQSEINELRTTLGEL